MRIQKVNEILVSSLTGAAQFAGWTNHCCIISQRSSSKVFQPYRFYRMISSGSILIESRKQSRPV